MVWSHFSNTAISSPLGMGFKRVMHQMKGSIYLYPEIREKIRINMNREKYELKTHFLTFIF